MVMSKSRKDPKGQSKEPMKCWFVEITLTSGEGLQFYVTAKDEEQALWKAETYSIQCENEGLNNYYKGKGFTLLP